MHTTKTKIGLIGLASAAVLLSSSLVFADGHKKDKERMDPEERIEQMEEKLGLTDAQVELLKQSAEARELSRELMEAFEESLTDAQELLLEEIHGDKKERRGKHKHKHDDDHDDKHDDDDDDDKHDDHDDKDEDKEKDDASA